MLTPSHNDPNRKAELKRKEKYPETFSSSRTIEKPKDWSPSTGLRSLNGRPLASDPRTEATKSINAAKEKISALKEELKNAKDKDGEKEIMKSLSEANEKLAGLIGQ